MHPTDRSHLPFGHSAAIQDPETVAILNNLKLDLPAVLSDKMLPEVFCNQYLEWIMSTQLNTITGLEQFPYKCYSNGTTEAFDKFYMKHHTRRLRCFRGDYMYHQLAWRNNYPNWLFLDDECLDVNDAVVISLPFADTGDDHHLHQALLDGCDRLGIPVLVDCAYLGICSNIDFNFSHKCITDIVFSLSKTFPVAHARIGVRVSREDDDDTLFVYNKSLYTNRIGAAIGLEFIKKFSPDYIVEKYKNKQIDFCNEIGAEASKTVLFGIVTGRYPEYNRGRDTNRLSFHKFYHLNKLELLNEVHR
jgi:hypothetical protein